MPFSVASPELDQDYERLVGALAHDPGNQTLQASAAGLAYSIRSRCMDLATWKADYSPEYNKRVAQAATLTMLAQGCADEVLLREFGHGSA